MRAIETKGRILPNGRIQIDEPIDMPVGEVRLVILFPDAIVRISFQSFQPKKESASWPLWMELQTCL